MRSTEEPRPNKIGGGGGGVEEGLEWLPIAPPCTPHPSHTTFDPDSSIFTSPSIFSTSPPSYHDPNSSYHDPNTTTPIPDFHDSVFCTIANYPGATIVSPILLCLAGITGHIGALWYLLSNSPRASSRTVFHIFLLTLMWTDFIGKLATTFPVLTAYATGQWTGGKGMCDYHGFSMVIVSMVTHFTVASMAVERFLGICRGYFYGRHVTPLRSKYLLVGIWVFCSLFSLLPLFDVGQFFLNYPCTWCFANLHICHDTPVRHRFFTMALGVINVANLITIIVCNIMVVGTLLRMRVMRRVPARLGQQRSRGQTDHELQMVVVLVVITIVFTTSWAPLDVILVTSSGWPPHLVPKDHLIELVAVRLASISQIVDPWVYIICRVAFRSCLWRWCRVGILGRWWTKREDSGGSWRFNLSSFIHARKSSKFTYVPETPPILPNDAAPELVLTPTSKPLMGNAAPPTEPNGQQNHTDATAENANLICLHPEHIPPPHARSQQLHPHSQRSPNSAFQGRGRLVRSNSWGCPLSYSNSTSCHASSHTRIP